MGYALEWCSTVWLRQGLKRDKDRSHQQPIIPAGGSNESSVSEGVILVVHHSITGTWGHKMGNFTKSKRLRQDAPQEILTDLVFSRKREIKPGKKSDEAYRERKHHVQITCEPIRSL